MQLGSPTALALFHQHSISQCSISTQSALEIPEGTCKTACSWLPPHRTRLRAFSPCLPTQQPSPNSLSLFPFFSDRHLQSPCFLPAECPGCKGKGICFCAGKHRTLKELFYVWRLLERGWLNSDKTANCCVAHSLTG